MMRNQLKALRQSANLSTEEHKNLNNYRKEGALITMIMKFLNIAPSSCRQYKSAVAKTESQISDFSERTNAIYGKS